MHDNMQKKYVCNKQNNLKIQNMHNMNVIQCAKYAKMI